MAIKNIMGSVSISVSMADQVNPVGHTQKDANVSERQSGNAAVIKKTASRSTYTVSEIQKILSAGKILVDGVELELSEEAKQALEEARSQAQGCQYAVNEYQSLMDQMEAGKKNAEAAAEGAEEYVKIMEIARRISRGDKVPATDEKKLMEYDSDLYQMAKTAAMLRMREKHKKYDSLWKDEEDKRQKNRTEGTAETATPVEAGVEVKIEITD